MHARVKLIESVLGELSKIISGRTLATGVIFPSASVELVEGLYNDNAISDFYNGCVAQVVEGYLKAHVKSASGKKIRILEVGAGTGGTSSMVFPKLEPYKQHIQDYTFTDVSKAFLINAERKFEGTCHNINLEIFDIEKSPSDQGFLSNDYDIVIASNVIHATQNIRKALRNIKEVMNKHAVLILNEITGSSLFNHLCFGLLDGWWKSEDKAFREPHCPALSGNNWKSVLKNEGFSRVAVSSGSSQKFGQQIILAESNGLIVSTLKDYAPLLPSVKHTHCSKQPFQASETNCHHQYLEDEVESIIVSCLVESLKVDQRDIDSDDTFSEYGVDSIIGVGLIQKINDKLKIELESTTLFDHHSVRQLKQHIVDNFQPCLVFADESKATANYDEDTVSIQVDKYSQRPSSFRGETKNTHCDDSATSKDISNSTPVIAGSIAIIGMSGRFPGANTVDELWNLIAAGEISVQQTSRWNADTRASEESSFTGGFIRQATEATQHCAT